MKAFHIRDARPSDSPFLAECIMAGMHFTDFDEFMTGDGRQGQRGEARGQDKEHGD